MSESAATPSPAEPSASAPSEHASSPLPEASAAAHDAAAAPRDAKRKRKRKRKRKGGTAGAVASPADGNVNEGAAAEPPRQAVAPAHPPGQKTRTSGKDQKAPHNKKRGPEPNRRPRRDGDRPLRTQEQLASWRWHPTATQLTYFPTVVANDAPAAAASVSPESDAALGSSSPETAALAINAADGDSKPEVVNDGGEASSETLATAPDTDETEGADHDGGSGAQGSADVSASESAAQAPAGDVSPDAPSNGATDAVVPTEKRSRDATAEARPHVAQAPRWSVPQGPRLAPWLGSVWEQTPPAERASLMVSLCSHRNFRQHVPQVDAVYQRELRSLAAVYDAIFLDVAPTVAPSDATGEPQRDSAFEPREELRRGLEAVCRGSVDILRSWPLAARERLNELAEDYELDNALSRDASRLFFDAPKLVGRVGLRAICDALSHGQDTTARELIKTVGAQPGVPGLLPMLTEALEGQRFGSLVILSYGGAQSRGPDPKAPKRHSGFCLESQRDVWIRTGESQDSSAFEHYSQVHRRALLPGVVGLYAFGVTRSRKPYAAVLRKGISLQRRIGHAWGLQRHAAVGLAAELTLLTSGMCRAGLRLPDLDPRRFEIDDDGRVWLSDVWGAELMEPRAQDSQAVAVCRETVVNLLANQPGFLLPQDWREVLSHSADFETIVATLRKLEKSRFWRN